MPGVAARRFTAPSLSPNRTALASVSRKSLRGSQTTGLGLSTLPRVNSEQFGGLFFYLLKQNQVRGRGQNYVIQYYYSLLHDVLNYIYDAGPTFKQH